MSRNKKSERYIREKRQEDQRERKRGEGKGELTKRDNATCVERHEERHERDRREKQNGEKPKNSNTTAKIRKGKNQGRPNNIDNVCLLFLSPLQKGV